MRPLSAFDRRVLPESAVAFLRRIQDVEQCHLGGGAALSGAFLAHRLSQDIDLFVHDRDAMRGLVREVPAVAEESGARFELRQDSPSFVRGTLTWPDHTLVLDLVHEPLADLEAPPPPIEGVVVESLTDLRASKLTCLLSRAEPRDLVDVLFLERNGFSPEADLSAALQKDGGVDPGLLAWLLSKFPLEPFPKMLEPLTVDDLRTYRDELAERMRRAAHPA